MARLNFVKKARKDIIEDGKVVIKKGESYYHWTLGFRGRKRVSKTRPDRRQLTQSAHAHRIYDFEDQIADIGTSSPEDMQSAVESLISELEDYKSELESNLESVPEQLQESHVNNERIEALDSAISEFEQIDFDFEYDESSEESEDEQRETWMQEKLEEIQGIGLE